MYKELEEGSLVKFLYLANEDSEVQIYKKCTQIYPKVLTKFQSASNQSTVLITLPCLLNYALCSKAAVIASSRYLK